MVAGDGTIWTSTDHGHSWELTGSAPPKISQLVYRGALDPANLDHILVGSAVTGAWVTFDGGRNWQQAAAK